MNPIVKTKSRLAIVLSGLQGFKAPKLCSEQYCTDSETAAEALWFAFMMGDITGKAVADLGSGTGILGIGAALLGARKVFFVEKDAAALAVSQQNLRKVSAVFHLRKGVAEFVNSDIGRLAMTVDTVVQNPPFGTKRVHADRAFLLNAFRMAYVVYSFHKSSTDRFVRAFARDSCFEITNVVGFGMILGRTHRFHRKEAHRVKVNLYRAAKVEGGSILATNG